MKDEDLLSAFMGLRPKVQTMVRRFLHDEEEVSDTLQDTFYRLWTNRGKIKSEDHAKAFIVQTAKNVSIDKIRRRESHRTSSLEDEKEPADSSSEDDTDREEQYRIVQKIIDGHLSDLQKKVLRLKEYEGKSVSEVAEILNMQPTSVRMHLSRIRKTIRDCYNKRKS